MRFLFQSNGITNLLRYADTQIDVLFPFLLYFFFFPTDWNQGLLIAVARSSMLGCFTSSYRRDLLKIGTLWNIYCILYIRIFYFQQFLLHLIV